MCRCELDHKESWALKNWGFWTVALETTLESNLDCKKIKPVNPEGNQSQIFIGITDDEVEAPILWPPFAKKTHWKRPWCRARLRARGEGDNRGWDSWMASLTQWTWVWANSGRYWRTGKPVVLQSWGCKELDTAERLNNSNSTIAGLQGLACMSASSKVCKLKVGL